MKYANQSVFYCTQCGGRGIPIQRIRGKEREAGHLKKIFCLKCQCETNHAETKEFTKYSHEDFLTEMKYNNFTKEGLRKIPYGQLKGLINDGKI